MGVGDVLVGGVRLAWRFGGLVGGLRRPGSSLAALSARTPCSSTLAPRVMSSGAVYSSGEWLMPSRLGTKIMPTGPSSAMLWASCPAPDGMRMAE